VDERPADKELKMRMTAAVLNDADGLRVGRHAASGGWPANATAHDAGQRRVRDAQHRDALRYTVWYPAQAGSRETALTIGPDAPLFDVGRSAGCAGRG
jgi:hypothetical protein